MRRQIREPQAGVDGHLPNRGPSKTGEIIAPRMNDPPGSRESQFAIDSTCSNRGNKNSFSAHACAVIGRSVITAARDLLFPR